MLQLFNTLSGRLEEFTPLDPEGRRIKMYVCGPTVYSDAHLGHARCYITWDVLYRFLRFLGYEVDYVRNVTDVDDKILNRARERGEDPADLAERNYRSFSEDMAALNILPPGREPRATQHIPHMLAGIRTLIEKGAAYITPDGSAYFRVSAKADYGKLKFATQDPEVLRRHLEDLKAGARVDVDEGKESPLDFALWKAIPPDDPNGWESPWPATGASRGWGRPGWHMECSAMNYAMLGEQIDIHAGGADLIFPHHENEIAQSEAWTGKKPFARYWMHNGFVNVNGTKMSKSLDNFSTIKKVLAQYDANTIRYFLLINHYRMPVDFNEDALESARNRIVRVRRVLQEACRSIKLRSENLDEFASSTDRYADEKARGLWRDFREAMLADLNTSKALAAFDAAVSAVGGARKPEEDSLKLVVSLADRLGFNRGLFFPDKMSQQDTLSGETGIGEEQLIRDLRDRKQAKQDKDWQTADSIRKKLADIGFQILDNKDGTTSVEKDGQEIVRV